MSKNFELMRRAGLNLRSTHPGEIPSVIEVPQEARRIPQIAPRKNSGVVACYRHYSQTLASFRRVCGRGDWNGDSGNF